MPYSGHCNCGSIQVTLQEKPSSSVACHCHCCRRAGGLFSTNYAVDENSIDLKDQNNTLTVYEDKNTTSGNSMFRKFCGGCGSPIYSIGSGKAFLKGTLFDEVAPVGAEVFCQRREGWLKPIEGAKQI